MRPVLIPSGSACWKRSNSGAIAFEKKKLSDGTGATRGCEVMIRWSHHVPLRRAPKLKIALSLSGLSALLTRADGTGWPDAALPLRKWGWAGMPGCTLAGGERVPHGALLGRARARGRLLVRRQPARLRIARRGRVLGGWGGGARTAARRARRVRPARSRGRGHRLRHRAA